MRLESDLRYAQASLIDLTFNTTVKLQIAFVTRIGRGTRDAFANVENGTIGETRFLAYAA